MRISEVVGITGARLLNQPSISGINNICFSLDKLHRGNLFITKNPKDIKQAVKKGAFGILFEGDFTPIDEEIAWLKIDSLTTACIAFVRYLLVDCGLKAIAFDPITLEIAQSLSDPEKVLFANHDIFAFLDQISPLFGSRDQTEIPTYIFTTQNFLDMINIDPCEVLCLKEPQLTLNASSLFQMKIIFESQPHTLPMPALFFDHLYALVKIMQSLQIPFDFKQASPIKQYHLYYFNSEGYLSKNQESHKVLIVVGQFQLFKSFATYLEQQAKWANKYYFLPPDTEKISIKNKIIYKTPEEAIKKLRQKSYHFALLYTLNEEHIITPLIKKNESIHLLEYAY